MKITIEISGGFAHFPALAKPLAVDTSEIDQKAAHELESLVRDAGFFDLPPLIDTTQKGAADYRTYCITVQEGTRIHEIRLTDPIEDQHLVTLVSNLQSIARR